MNRRTVIACLVAIFAIIGTFAMGSSEARAQNSPLCCQFTVDASQVPATCMPLPVTTAWGGVPVRTVVYTSPGVYVEQFAPPFYPNCPPAPSFLWVSLNSGTTKIPYNVPTRTFINGCCVIVHAVVDANGCMVINITPC